MRVEERLPNNRQLLCSCFSAGGEPQEVDTAGQPRHVQLPLVASFPLSVHHGLNASSQDVVEMNLDVLPLRHGVAERDLLLRRVRIGAEQLRLLYTSFE